MSTLDRSRRYWLAIGRPRQNGLIAGRDASSYDLPLSEGCCMGVRGWFSDLLARGEPIETDPDALRQVAVVPLHEGPMLVAGLEREGVKAIGIESFDVITGALTRMRIVVRQADVAVAGRILERLR
jgi:hypothetical protein